jgi:hypothetical protein
LELARFSRPFRAEKLALHTRAEAHTMESNSLVSSTLSDEKGKSISPIEERLISILKDGGPLTRDQLVKKMAVPRTTIYDGLKKLIMRNEVKKIPVLPNGAVSWPATGHVFAA